MAWFVVLTLLWLVVAALARRAHQRVTARAARRWTTRLYAVTLVPLTALAVGGALVAVQLTLAEAGTAAAIAAAAPYAQWLAIAVNVVLVDIVIRRHEGAPRAATVRQHGFTRHSPSKRHPDLVRD